MNKTSGFLRSAFIAATAALYVGITNVAAFGAFKDSGNMSKEVGRGGSIVAGALLGGVVAPFLAAALDGRSRFHDPEPWDGVIIPGSIFIGACVGGMIGYGLS